MKVSVDTNILIRAVVRDDPAQAALATKALKDATLIAVSIPCLCEFVWVLRKLYGYESDVIANAIRSLINAQNVVTHHPAVELGLSIMDAGGDFADGVMAFEGARLGGEIFLSFDKKAVTLLSKHGSLAKLLK